MFGGDLHANLDLPGKACGNFSNFPPLSAAPSSDLLSKLAFEQAKVRQMELQLRDEEERGQERLKELRLAHGRELERIDTECKRLEMQLQQSRERHDEDLRHLTEKKQMLLQNADLEKEAVRRDERRKAQLEHEKLRADHQGELEEIRKRHERALAIAQQQAELEAESLRNAHSGEQQLAKLVEQVQGSVLEVERMSRRVEGDKTLEYSCRERQLEAREKNARELEARLSLQSKEAEDQRKRLEELVRHMEHSQHDERADLAVERERLEKEHKRLLELQNKFHEAERFNKESLKHAWSQLDEERRAFQQDQLRAESEMNARTEELEVQERHVRQETERLRGLHGQIEAARQNASRRIRETEATVANERRALMNDIEVFEEKRKLFAAEVEKLELERRSIQEVKASFEHEVKSVGDMAMEVQRKSEDLKVLHDQTAEARAEMQQLRDRIQEERQWQDTKHEQLKTMQTLVEQQRLQLLQTENQIRVKGIEDIDLMVTTQAQFPADENTNDALEAWAAALDNFGGAGSPNLLINTGLGNLNPSAATGPAPAYKGDMLGISAGEPPLVSQSGGGGEEAALARGAKFGGAGVWAGGGRHKYEDWKAPAARHL